MKTLCLVLDSSSDAAALAAELPPRDQVCVLVFAPGGEIYPGLQQVFAGAEFLDVREQYRTFLPIARDRFTQFVAEFPEKYRVGTQSFKQWLRRDNLSLWWLVELSQKNPESSPIFNTYCLAVIFREVLRTRSFDRVFIIGGDTLIVSAYEQICKRARISVHRFGVRRNWQATLPGLLVRRIMSALIAVLRRSTARQLPSALPNLQPVASCRVAFHSWFPMQWTTWNTTRRDRYYVDLPDVCASRGAQVWYACTFFGVSYRDLDRARRDARTLPPDLQAQMVWIEALVPFWNVLRIFADVGIWLRFEWLARTDPRLKQALTDGLEVDLSALLLQDMRASFATLLPVYRLLAEQIRHFCVKYRPTDLVTTLETYCYGRAVVWGARAAKTNTRVVGLQHSPVNPNQLFYRYRHNEITGADALPLPDEFLLHSHLAQNWLCAAGVDQNRLHLTGAPRFAALVRYRQRRREDRAGLRRELGLPLDDRLVLVAGVIWREETLRLLKWSFQAAAQMDDVALVIKLHPAQPELGVNLEALTHSFPTVRWQLVNRSLNALQAATDVMVTGNSSSDIEAIAIGCPVIKASTFNGNASPTDEFPGVVIQATSAAELATALQVASPRADGHPIVEWALGPLDAANERIVQVLLHPSVK